MENEKLTYSQACCLTLGLSPSNENRKKAKVYFQASPLDVCCYIIFLGARRPIAIGKDVMERYPFTFQSYTNTRTSSLTHVLGGSENHPADDQIGYITEIPACNL